MKYAINISKHQGTVDWKKVTAEFVIIRAAELNGYGKPTEQPKQPDRDDIQDDTQDEIAALRKEVAALREKNAELWDENELLRKDNTCLMAMIAAVRKALE